MALEQTKQLKATFYQGVAGLNELLPRWEKLQQNHSANPFSNPKMVKKWWELIARQEGSATDSLDILALEDPEALRAVFALTTTRVGTTHTNLRRLRTLGAIPGSNWWEMSPFIIEAGFEPQAIETLISTLQEQRDNYHGMDLERVAITEPWKKSMAQVDLKTVRTEEPLFLLPLPANYEQLKKDIKESLKQKGKNPKNTLEAIRRGEKYVNKTSPTRFELVTEPDQIPEALDQLFNLHIQRSQMREVEPHPNHFPPHAQLFIRNLASDLAAEGDFIVARLMIDNVAAAARILLPAGDHLFFSSSGFDQRFAEYRVMSNLTIRCLQWAIENDRFKIVNLSSGTDKSKTIWQPTEQPVGTWHFSPKSLGPKLGEIAYDLALAAKRHYPKIIG
jgi:hypothetical protein